ncbi:MAG: alpha/beta fold hydrolase [Rhodanobacteraceae bacterium]
MTNDLQAAIDPVELRVDTPSGALAALQWGAPDAPALLALHGWLDNAASLAALAPLIATRHRVIALDLPGHGHSAHLPRHAYRYHFVDYIDCVLAAADALKLETFDLLGHSLGAGIASLAAAATPARIRALALIEGLGPVADDGSQTLARWRDAHLHRTRPRRAPRVFASVDAAIAARVAVGGLDAEEARPIVARNLREVDGGFTWRSDARLRRATPLRLDEPQVRRLLAGITASTLLLLADPAAPYLPAARMDARVACVADIRVEHITGPHHLHIRKPQAVARSVSSFLDEKQPVKLPS